VVQTRLDVCVQLTDVKTVKYFVSLCYIRAGKIQCVGGKTAAIHISW